MVEPQVQEMKEVLLVTNPEVTVNSSGSVEVGEPVVRGRYRRSDTNDRYSDRIVDPETMDMMG